MIATLLFDIHVWSDFDLRSKYFAVQVVVFISLHMPFPKQVSQQIE